MADLLQVGATWLGGVLTSHVAHQVTYHRGAKSVTVSASVVNHRAETSDKNGVMTSVETYEAFITRADLLIDLAAVTPRPGDRIKDSSDWFEVAPLGLEPCVRRSGIRWRIHLKYIGVE